MFQDFKQVLTITGKRAIDIHTVLRYSVRQLSSGKTYQ